MLMLKTQSAPLPAWVQTLQPGDVVLFAFPCAEPNEPPKRRTCLVLDIVRTGSRPTVEIAYGTSADTSANVGLEIRVTSPDDMAAAGVRRPTRFVGARRMVVPFDHSGWDVNASHSSPVIGRLPAGPMARLHAVRARLHAERDIAADRRAEKRRTFTVEHRRRRSVSIPGKAVQG